MRLLSLAMMLVVGCGTGDSPEAPADLAPPPLHNWAQINRGVLQASCTFSVCHSTRGSHDADKLDLTQDPYGSLVKAAAQNKQALAQNLLRVKPCDVDNSFLITKLTMSPDNNDSDSGFGAHMPLKNPSLPDFAVQAVKDWVARGALEDEPDDVSGTTCAAR